MQHARIKIFNETIEYDITNEEPARLFEKIIRIWILDKIRYPLISTTINTEHENVVNKVWTEMQNTWKNSACVPNVDNFTDGNE